MKFQIAKINLELRCLEVNLEKINVLISRTEDRTLISSDKWLALVCKEIMGIKTCLCCTHCKLWIHECSGIKG